MHASAAAASDAKSPCEREAIHLPGAIQPHGAMLAVLPGSGVVSHASANLHAFLGCRAEDVLGRPLEHAIGAAASRQLSQSDPSGAAGSGAVRVMDGPGGIPLYLRAHRSGQHLCIDIEPMPAEPMQGPLVAMAQSLVDGLRHAAHSVEICERAVRGLKQITGYARVMAYRFGVDGHGEVIAEALEPGLEPYLGLRYPASDIPSQARRQYLRQRVGAIADSSYTPVPLLTDAALHDGTPIDLTHSALRSVSPFHCEYMRNMQTAASLTVGLANGTQLWGMLVCHNASPRIAGPELQAAAGLVGEVVSLRLASLEQAEIQAQRLGRDAMLRNLVARLAVAAPLSAVVADSQADLLGLVDAGGAVVRFDGALFRVGRTPPLRVAERALAVMQAQPGGAVIAVDDVALRFPNLAECTSDGSGALLVRLDSHAQDAILWFRPELSRSVVWGGDPAGHGTADPVSGRVSPRTSFKAWKETVRGHSAPWSPADQALALELRDAVGAAVARRTRAALRESEARFQLLAEHSGVVVTLNDMNSTRSYVSPAAERVLGWRPEDMVGRNAIEFVHPDDQQAFREAHAALLDGSGERSACYRYMRPDGSWLWLEDHARLRAGVDGAAPTDYVVVLRDATERKAAEEKLMEVLQRMERMASMDGLTGLANRRHFDETAATEWRRCERERLPISLLLLDADNFKLYNDRYGHLAGDGCLRAIASQLEAAAQRPGDLAARYGGEEFLVLMPNTGTEGASDVAERLRGEIQGLAIAHEANSAAGVVTVSVGVATACPGRADSDIANIDALLSRADAALYRAKRSGRNRVVTFIDADDGDGDAAPFDDDERSHTRPVELDEPDDAHEALMQFLYRTPIGLVQTTLDGAVEMINPMAASLLMPLSPNGGLDNLFVALDGVAPQLRTLTLAFAQASGAVCESVHITLGGEKSAAQILSVSLLKLDETRLMAMVSDITHEIERERSGLDRRLAAAARTDSLTQMPNRAVMRDLIQRAIERGRNEPGYEFAVLFLNCDRFRQLNDSLGHSAGDELLELTADRLRATLRQSRPGNRTAGSESMAGRLGGDEFVVLLDDLRSADDVHGIAQRVLDALSQPFGVRTLQLHFSFSMGVVMRAEAMADADAVLRDSSIAMVEAKRAGGARYVVFERAMHERASRRGDAEADLRRALSEGQLFVVYQPVVALHDADDHRGLPARAAGVEALVRWRHPTRGVVPPVDFIGVAEECGLIGAVGEFVLATACRDFVGWQRELGRLAPRLLAVNLSRGQLGDPRVVSRIGAIVESSGINPACLQLEVTESLAAQDESVQACLQQLKAFGLTLALDDFGTGYSSLASLHLLPVSTVKIDRSFVSEAVDSAHHRVLIEATVRVANSLQMGTVAEGIETEAQAVLLRLLGCQKGQGYFFSKPLLPPDLVRWLKSETAAPLLLEREAPAAVPG